VKVTFTANGWDNYIFWVRNDPNLLARINDLIEGRPVLERMAPGFRFAPSRLRY
jgi:hypothetical protein